MDRIRDGEGAAGRREGARAATADGPAGEARARTQGAEAGGAAPAGGGAGPRPEPGVEAALALLVGGPGGREAARRMLAGCPLVELARHGADELAGRFALGRRGAERLAAAFALGRRVERAERPKRPSMRSPRRVFEAVAPSLRGLERETFLALLLDGKHRLKRCELVSEGTLTTSLVHPREVFRAAVREAAAAVVVAHNHPSGDPEPSVEDVEVTRRLAEAGRLLGVPLLDHLVVGDGAWVSLRERMEW